MDEKKSLPFNGTPEQEQRLLAVINEGKTEKGALMAIMQKAQDIYGYLPIEVQTIIARELEIPLQEVYGVATFYAQFSCIRRVNTRFRFALVPLVMLRVPVTSTKSYRKSWALPAANARLTVNSRWKPAVVSALAVWPLF